MTPRIKLSPLLFGGLVAIGAFFWLRSLASWRPVKLGEINYELGGLSFLSSDGKMAILHGCTFNYSSIVNLQAGTRVDWPWPEQPMDGICFSQKSPEYILSTNVTAGRGELRVRELRTGRVMRNFHWIAKHTQRTFPILLDREEKTVSIIDAPSIFQWDLQSGKLLRQVKLENPFPPKLNSFERFAFSSDGAQLIGCAEGQGRIWDFQSGKVVKSWTTKSQSVPVDFSPDARVVIYLLRSLRPNYSFVDTSTGKVQWKLNGSLPFPHTFADGGHEMWFPKKANCEIRDAYTGKTKRYNAFPCQRDGEILRVTSDYIYTQNDKGTVFRWRAR